VASTHTNVAPILLNSKEVQADKLVRIEGGNSFTAVFNIYDPDSAD
jgi:hypothetical protein